MKNFDTDRKKRQRTKEQRTFQVCGETFVMKKAIRPEALAAFDDLTEDASLRESMEIIDGMFLTLIEKDDDAEARYRAVREQEDDPLSIDDIREMIDWMVEESSGRPTGSPSVSTGGREPTGTSSTDESSSLAAVA